MKNRKGTMIIAGALVASMLVYSSNAQGDIMSHQTLQTTQYSSAVIDTTGGVDTSQISFSDKDIYTDYTAEGIAIKVSDNGSITGDGYQLINNVLTISKAGTYVLSGTLSEGQIVVEASSEEDVRLVFNNLSVSCSSSAPVYVKSADKTIISLPAGTQNTIADKRTVTDEEITSAIYSKDTLTVNGSGKLTIQASSNDGITSKDKLKITGGELSITAVDDGIVGKDCVLIRDGKITITSDGDGIKSTNSEVDTGYVYIEGGTITVNAKKDGIQAESSILIKGGSINLTTNGGSANGEVHNDNPFGGGWSDQTTTETSTTESAKGLKANAYLDITGGTLNINSSDDTIHSGNTVRISGGTLTLQSGDDGVHADSALAILGGTTTITKSYEGLEAPIINVAEGKATITASDDGINASNPNSTVGDMQADSSCQLNISGGELNVDASGDGVDSNGAMTISGGTVKVNGPSNSGNGFFDANGEFQMNGGTVIAIGSSGMLELPGNNSSQRTIVYGGISGSAGSEVVVKDSQGKELGTITSARAFSAVAFSSADITSGQTYSIYVNGSLVGSVTSQSITTTVGASTQGGGQGGFPGWATVAPTATATPKVTAAPTATATPKVTATPTATATPKVTVAPTTTPVTSDGTVTLVNTNKTASTSGTINTQFTITNTGSSAIDLSNIKIRYYYTSEDNKTQHFYCDYANLPLSQSPWNVVITNNVSSTLGKLTTPKEGADSYCDLTFEGVSQSLVANQKLTLQGRIVNTDWSTMNQANDYSYQQDSNIVVYNGDSVIFGVEPQ